MSQVSSRTVVRSAPGAADPPAVVSSDTDAAEWDRFVERREDSTSYHLWGWRHVFERAFGHETCYLIARRDACVVGVLPLVKFRSRLFGRFMVSLPFVNYGGVLADDDEAALALTTRAVAIARDECMSHVELRHRIRRFPDLPVKQHKVAMIMRLQSEVDRTWQGLDRKVRNQIRKAEKSGLTPVTGGLDRLDAFYRVFAQNMRDLGTPVYPRQFFAEMLTEFPDRAGIVAVNLGPETIAAGITFTYHGVVEVPSASSLRAHRALCPNHLMYWTVIERAIADGLHALDFGRSTPDEGTYQFKRHWGAEALPLAWEYGLVGRNTLPDRSVSNPKFRAAGEIWKHIPVPVASWLGPRIVRFLP
jgi:FemAB-related protein (PEP-CTERM system-associated)